MNITRYPYLKLSEEGHVATWQDPSADRVKKEWIVRNPVFDGNWDESCGKRIRKGYKKLSSNIRDAIVANVDLIEGFSGQTFHIDEIKTSYPDETCYIEEESTRSIETIWTEEVRNFDPGWVCVSRYTCTPYRNLE